MANVPFFFEGGRKVFFGSAANRTTELAVSNPGAHYQEIGGNLYESNGAVWNSISISGAVPVTERPLVREFFISTGGYLYEGYAPWGTDTSAAAWQMFRTPSAGGTTERADGGAFTQIADNYASLTYGAT